MQVLQPLPAVELATPGGTADLAAVAFPVREHLDGAHLPRSVDTDAVSDHVLPPEDLVDEHVAEDVIAAHRLPCPQRTVRGLWAGELRYRLLLVRVQRQEHFVEAIRLSKKATLRRIDGQVVSGDRHLGGGHGESS